MDAINRNQEFMIRPYMFVLFGSPSELLNQVTGDEEYLGIYLNQLNYILIEKIIILFLLLVQIKLMDIIMKNIHIIILMRI